MSLRRGRLGNLASLFAARLQLAATLIFSTALMLAAPLLPAAEAAPSSAAHAMHDNDLHGLLLIDRLELWDEDSSAAWGWEGEAWLGTDLNRLWLRSEGERWDGATAAASLEALWGHSYARWWDVVAGLRHDFGRQAGRDYLALGVQGLAPYWFEIAATGYIGDDGHHAARIEVEHELLFTQRLVLQSLLKADGHARKDAPYGIGAGLSSIELGLRLRYEFTRRFAPYVGLSLERVTGDTADLRRLSGHSIQDTRMVLGLRTWF